MILRNTKDEGKNEIHGRPEALNHNYVLQLDLPCHKFSLTMELNEEYERPSCMFKILLTYTLSFVVSLCENIKKDIIRLLLH